MPKSQSHKICVLGVPNSGVRHYIASLLLLMQDRYTSIREAWRLPNVEDNYETKFYRTLFQNYGKLYLPEGHESLKRFQLRRDFRHRFRWYSTAIEIHRLSGEQFLSTASDQELIEQLTDAAGILLLIDPLVYLLKPKQRARIATSVRPAEPEAENLLMKLIDVLRNSEGALSDAPLQTPVAMLYSKRDLYPGSSLEALRTESFDLRNIHRIYEYNFRNRWSGCVSSIGRMWQTGSRSDFVPQNVLEPFLWVTQQEM